MSLRAAYLAMHRRTGLALARTETTADQFVVLAALSDADALTQQELVSRTSSDANTVRAMLVLLEGRDLIKRRPHPTDGRARSVSLTPKGRKVFWVLWRESRPLRAALMKSLVRAEAEALVDQLWRIAKALEPDRVEHAKTINRFAADSTS